MDPNILARFDRLNVWKRGDNRAPHKPLLLLYALGRLARGEPAFVSFKEAEPILKKLLEQFGPRTKSLHPELPFWHLRNDQVWEVPDAETFLRKKGGSSPTASELRKRNAFGGFAEDVRCELAKDPTLIAQIAERLLQNHFPESLHSDILDEVGLTLESRWESTKRKRDPKFREAVLTAYRRRCAVCRLDIRLGQITIGLDAAHIRWHQTDGPDEVSNGIALCAFHHKAFDYGCFMIRSDGTIAISELLTGNDGLEEMLDRFHGKKIDLPVHPDHHPTRDHLEWHKKEVFKGDSRYIEG